MRIRRIVVLIAIIFLCSMQMPAYGMHPLITDDAGTQGKNNFQFEKNGEYDYQKGTTTGVELEQKAFVFNNVLTYGIVAPVDLVLTLPYVSSKVRVDGEIAQNAKGWSDITFEAKWRFYEIKGFTFALKPGIIIPLGDDDKGLGNGKVGYSTFLIATKEMDPWAFHANLAYKRNENTQGSRTDLWHASIAAVRGITKTFRVAADLGIDTNTDPTSSRDVAYIIGGVIYSPLQNLDFDLGAKYFLTGPDTNYSLLAGLTVRF